MTQLDVNKKRECIVMFKTVHEDIKTVTGKKRYDEYEDMNKLVDMGSATRVYQHTKELCDKLKTIGHIDKVNVYLELDHTGLTDLMKYQFKKIKEADVFDVFEVIDF